MDKREPLRKDIKRKMLDIEDRLHQLGKVLKLDPYNIIKIRAKLEKGGISADDTLFKELAEIEEILTLMAKIFNKPLDLKAVNRFTSLMHRNVLSPTRQALVTEFLD